MNKREYFSIRTGKNPLGKNYNLETTKILVRDFYVELKGEGYFDEYFGFNCTNSFIVGKLGTNIEIKIFRALKKNNLYPFENKFLNYTEDDLFDVIEFLFDFVSKPISGDYHSYYECGMHWNEFDKKEGEKIFCKTINEIIIDYAEGFQLSDQGEILITSEKGLNEMLMLK